MATEVVMPQMGESIAEGTITKWLVKVGDKVERDQPLFEISTDKVDAEIPSPAAGVISEIRNKEGETVPVNQVVAMIGGLISTNAGGNRVLRYGMARDLVLGVEAVLADGTVIDALRKVIKNNSGYDVRQLFIGAEGTLGIVTAAVMKLVPVPLAHATAMATLPTIV
ncbi:MAG: FAD-binding protein [Leptolyngbyaceae cyanobacterium SU_3_3]|nr:FAD-binding protein [Leptolyngbyaceae cyanobacterium SU_3_3]